MDIKPKILKPVMLSIPSDSSEYLASQMFQDANHCDKPPDRNMIG